MLVEIGSKIRTIPKSQRQRHDKTVSREEIKGVRTHRKNAQSLLVQTKISHNSPVLPPDTAQTRSQHGGGQLTEARDPPWTRGPGSPTSVSARTVFSSLHRDCHKERAHPPGRRRERGREWPGPRVSHTPSPSQPPSPFLRHEGTGPRSCQSITSYRCITHRLTLNRPTEREIYTQHTCIHTTHIPVFNVLGGAKAPEAAVDHDGKSRAKSLALLHAAGKDRKGVSEPCPGDAPLGPNS